MERRWGNRVMLDETVAVQRDGETLGVACLHEVSLSGAFLKTRWRLPQLARVNVEVPQPEPGRRARKHLVEAFVVRHCADGVGLEWCDFAPPEVVAIMTERRHHTTLPPAAARLTEGAEQAGGPRRRLR